jgi:hypothetical protein
MGKSFEKLMNALDESKQMAWRLGENPHSDSQWPKELIERLIRLERERGKEALQRELDALLRRLPPHIDSTTKNGS